MDQITLRFTGNEYKSWYKIHADYTCELTELAPQEAKELFEIYQKEMKLRKKGV